MPADEALSERRHSRRIMVGPVPVGGGAPISVQSMTNTKTSDVNATLQQIAELAAAGCDIVRVAVPSQDDSDALAAIVRHSPIPVIADVHFQSKYVFQAIDAGCAAVRVNPGNIRKFDEVGSAICEAATQAGISLRIGVNAGSLDKDIYAKYGGPTPQALVASAVKEARMFEEVGFHDFKISVKHHDPVTMIRTYRLLARQGDWPLHLGVTEAGPQWQGTIKSCLAFGVLLAEGIGDTIRVSLSAPPVEEVKVGCKVLEYLGLRERHFDIISCPSCGRAQVDVIELANAVTDGLKDIKAPIRVAVMGCIVNGPGEAREADLGVASGNGKGQIFIKGEVVETVPEDRIVATLLERAHTIADHMQQTADAAVPASAASDGSIEGSLGGSVAGGPIVVPIIPQHSHMS
ncbi:MAG: flavodoxin-dependent (E)-4-hydroxy-3-methylbut-2-enyl-diphosphate synthase [Bifidobacterium psychraerophilum]|uniref:flavodoxin-dependent (E)-4-hydroxy-3-methylbut-2-enyl-diphosphate synthase n=1 Tax=Bifidobacterium psychraerophilum TaxID=218140 RepID=UPI0039ED978C